MDEKRLAEIRERVGKLDEGVWRACLDCPCASVHFEHGGGFSHWLNDMGGPESCADTSPEWRTFANNNMAFVAAARTDIPDLLAQVERLTRERDLLARECGAARRSIGAAHLKWNWPGLTELEDAMLRYRKRYESAVAATDAAGVKVEG